MSLETELRAIAVDLEGTRNRFSTIVTGLNEAITELKITIAELRSEVVGAKERAIEDRTALAEVVKDVNSLKSWKSRIQGQIALLYFLVGLVSAAIIERFAVHGF